jgi:hypothetical protein
MTEKQFLENCKRIAGDSSDKPWDEDQMAGFFQRFRPEGKGVAAALKGIPEEDEVLRRLLQIYAATANAYPKDPRAGVDLYFVVRYPPPILESEVIRLGKAYLQSILELAVRCKSDALQNALTPISTVRISQARPKEPSDLEAEVYDALGDMMSELGVRRWVPHSLEEALYFIACEYKIAHFVLWPVYRKIVNLNDPFLAFFEMWRHGIQMDFRDDRCLHLCMT